MSEMIEVQAVELSGEALGWAVAQAEMLKAFIVDPDYGNPYRVFVEHPNKRTERYRPHDNWGQGGLLIEKYGAMVRGFPNQMHEDKAIANVRYNGLTKWTCGDTPLIALCRAVVHLKLGETVQVPNELQP